MKKPQEPESKQPVKQGEQDSIERTFLDDLIISNQPWQEPVVLTRRSAPYVEKNTQIPPISPTIQI